MKRPNIINLPQKLSNHWFPLTLLIVFNVHFWNQKNVDLPKRFRITSLGICYLWEVERFSRQNRPTSLVGTNQFSSNDLGPVQWESGHHGKVRSHSLLQRLRWLTCGTAVTRIAPENSNNTYLGWMTKDGHIFRRNRIFRQRLGLAVWPPLLAV